MTNSKRMERACYCILVGLIACVYLYTNTNAIYSLITNVDMFFDFRLRWRECAYLFRGINPYDIAHGISPESLDVGALPPIAGTVPWAYLLGNIFVFGFLPYRQAAVAFTAWFVIIPFLFGSLLYGEFRRRGIDLKFFLLAMGVVMISPHWLSSLRLGNYGGILSCLLIAIPFLVDRHPYLAGVLHALCMIKPQLAAPFYLYFLLTKRWKPMMFSGAIVGGAWVAVSLMVQRGPFSLLLDIYSTAAEDYGNGIFGLVSLLELPGVSRTAAMVLSALSGFAFIVVAFFVIRRFVACADRDLLFYCAVCVVSAFWFYKQAHDLIVVQFLFVTIILAIQKLRSPVFKFIICGFAYFLSLESGFLLLAKAFGVSIHLVRYLIWILLCTCMILFSLNWAPIAKLRGWLCAAQPFRARMEAFDAKPVAACKQGYCAAFAVAVVLFLISQGVPYWQGGRLLSNLKENGTLVCDTNFVEIYMCEGSLYYISGKYQEDNLRYYLHVYPEDEANLPEDRVQYGFSNYDSVLNNNMTRYSLFQPWRVNRFVLPPWPIAQIDTGEFGSDVGAWSLTWAPA